MSIAIFYPATRYSFSVLIAIFITFLLFYFMHYLILNNEDILIAKQKERFTINFVRLIEDSPPVHREPEPLPDYIEPPQTPKLDPFRFDETFDNTIALTEPIKKIEFKPKGLLGVGYGNTDIIPIVKIQPVYPGGAIRRNIEGYTIVEYTVTTNGTTKDIRVIKSQPANIFDKASVRATLKFKYKPKMVGGNPVEVKGVKNKFTFQFDD